MAEQQREQEGGQGNAPRPGGDVPADALGYAEAIIATVREPLVVLEADLRVRTANRSFYRTFRVRPGETEGRLLYDLGNRQWDIPALRQLLGEILPRNTTFDDFEVRHDFPDIGPRVMLLNARKLYREGNHSELILLAIEDVTALREAERARRDAETRFTEVVKNVRDHSIFLTDPEGVITSWNVAAERIIGYSEGEAVGRHFSLIFSPEDVRAGAPEHELRQAREEGRAEDERWHVKKDGTRFWALGIVTPLHDAGGRLTGFSKILRDMTAWKRAEEQLAASRRRLQAVFDTSLDAILLADDQARLVDANPAACDLLGRGRDDLLHRGVFDITPPPNGDAGRAAWAAFVRTGRQSGEYEVSREDGTTAVVEYRAVANVQPGLHLSVLRDVSERKRTEEALRTNERRFKTLADSAPVGIFETDAQGNCVFVNRRWCEMAGMTPEAAAGRGWAAALHPEDRDRIFAEWYAAAAGGREFAAEYRFRTPAGRVTWLSGRAVAVRDEGGTITGYVGTVEDVTGLKAAEEQSRRRAEEVETLMEVMPVAVWLSRDRDCRHVLGNRAGYALLRMAPGTNLSKTAPAGERPTHFRVYRAGRELPPEELPLQYAAAHGVEVHGAEEDVVFADGAVAQIYGSASPLFDDRGAVRGAVAGFLDVSALRRAEVALRESEGRLRAIIDNSPSVIFVKDAEGRYLLANRACEGYSGEPPERMIGKTDRDYLPPEFAEPFRADDLRVLQAGQVARYEEEAPCYGEVRTYLTVKFPLRDADGRPYAVCGIATDITDLKRAGEALRQSEERLRTLSNNLPHGAIYQVVADSQGGRRFLYISAGVERLFGVTPAEAMADATALYGLIHDEDRPRLAAAEEAALRDQTLFDGEFRARARGGELRWLHCRSAPRRLPSGDVVWEGVMLDATARKDAEANLARLAAESEKRRRLYEAALSNTPDLVYVFDLDHRFTYANEGLLRMWGKTWDEAVGKNCLELGYEAWHAAMHDREIEQVVATRRPVKGEVPFTGTFGRRIYEYIFVPVVGEDGEVEAVAGTTRDVTERQALEARLRDQAAQLREADRRKDEFLATLAHELRNPLAPLRNGLQVMRLAGGNAAAVEQARGMMERQMAVMVRLIDDLLDVSRITRDKLELRKERVELAGVVQGAVEGSRPLLEAAAHRLTVALPPEPVWLDADATRLAQVFGNLLTNAAKYTERGGRITLTARRHGGEVAVAVRDDGIGVAAEHLPHLFEMFSQVDSALERSQGGLGIGLALVKGLVELHGGTVEARSEGLGKGSEFIVRLPVAGAAPTPAMGQSVGGTVSAAPPGKRILVADDNRDAADSLAMMLRLGGHEVHAAHDGQEAVEAASWFRPDVALLDIGMPKVNGFEAARRMRGQPGGARLVLVAVTGWGQEEDKRRAAEAGFDHHLTKPVDPAALEKLLSRLKTS